MKLDFHVEDVDKDSVEIRDGAESKKILNEKIKSLDYQLLNYKVVSLDTISKYLGLRLFGLNAIHFIYLNKILSNQLLVKLNSLIYSIPIFGAVFSDESNRVLERTRQI